VSINPWTVGQLSPTWTIQMIRDENIVMDLTGVIANQLSLSIYNASKVQIGTGAGTFVITSAYPGIVTYAPASADVSTAGSYYLRVKINFNNTSPDFSDYIPWTLQA
jgi:hypothetical protein